MTSPCCERIRPDLSAYADQTLPPKRWEQVAYHLAGCAECRAELTAIDAVCSELSKCRASDPSAMLAARLESIAGEQAAAPLYMASGPGELPSARRTRNRRVAQGSVAMLVVVMSAVVFAVLIAPEPLRISDPVKAAREQFSMSSSAVSVNEAVGAVLLAFERGADLGESVSYQPRGNDNDMRPVQPERAARLLRGATDSSASYTGTQRVWISDGSGHYRNASVRTTKVAGEGAQLEVFDSRGDRFMSSFLPAMTTSPVDAPDDWEFTEGAQVESVGGRDAVHLQANDGGRPVAAWWFDTDSGVLLWTERYEASGDVSLAMGYQELKLGEATLSEDVAQQISLHPASTSQTDGWCIGLARCPQEIAGLPLVAYAASDRQGHRSMTLVYSDGFESAVVGWTEGVLADGTTQQLAQGAGVPTVELWQCDDAVIWVTTNGSVDLVSEISQQLPQEEPYQASLVDKIKAGIDRLVSVG